MKRSFATLRMTVSLLLIGATALSAQRPAEDTVPRAHILPALGIHVGTPQKASFALGVVLGEDWQKNGRDHSRNVAVFAEPGLGAGRASVAYVDHGYGSFGSGYGIAATVLRTWKQPWQLDANQTYAGGEILLWPIVFTGPRIGLLHRVAGPNTDKQRWFITLDFGFGL
jgi:hypothetical protein